jgi:uncharacterized protein (DUF488 family)
MYNQLNFAKNESTLVASNSLPKYHRQKYLLALVELSGGMLTKMDLQKLLFLSEQTAKNEHYHFIPYHYGCYSFQAQSDIELMESRGWLKVNENQVQLSNSIVSHLTQSVIQQLKYVLSKYDRYRGNELVRYIYEQYPYFAIYSKIAEKILSQKAYKSVTQTGKNLINKESTLFTIGYEGISLEQYINQLIKNNVKLLCDVRINPLSRKFGFSKGSLSTILPKIGINYVHIPELGIDSEKRSHLEEKKDYANLFKAYCTTLENRKTSIDKVTALLAKHNRIALTCFEKEHDECHRHCVSDHIMKNDNLIKVVHL